MRKWNKIKRKPNVYWYDTAKGKRYGFRRGYKLDGKYHEASRSSFLTALEAETALSKLEHDLLMNGPSVVRGKHVTVDQYFRKFAARKVRIGDWRESTRKAIEDSYKKHLQPRFGSMPMDDINRSSYQSFLDDLSVDENGKPRFARVTVANIHRIMMMIFNSAEMDNTIVKNKLRGVAVNGRKPRAQDLEPADFKKWMAVAKKILDRYSYAMVRIGALGERRGELMGIRTTSIHFQEDQIHGGEIASITFDMQRNKTDPNGGPLKTESSYRTIWVSGDIIDLLHYAIMTANNLRTRNNRPVDKVHKAWLWVNQFGEPLHYGQFNIITKKVSDASGIKVHPHLLRHFVATQAIAHNAPSIDVMHYLGHKDLQMTADYTRPTKDASLDVFNALEGNNRKH